MKKIQIIAALTFPILMLVLWVIFLTVKSLTLPEVRVSITGYDPRDLLSGHYIAYTIDWENTDCTQFENKICPREEFRNYALKAYWGQQFRFYVPEQYASKLDDMFRYQRGNHKFEVIYKYRSGIKPMAKDLLIDGRPWKQIISEEK